jgi:hypothetical protein
MIKEAKALLHSEDIDYQVYFDDYPCLYMPSQKKSMSYYPPMIANYYENRLCVLNAWINAVVSDYPKGKGFELFVSNNQWSNFADR